VKALTVRQPWASLIVDGIKDVENRSWRTNYRGRLGIHAAQRFDQELMDLYGHLLDDDLPLGALIGSVKLIDCVNNSRSKVGNWWRLALDPDRAEETGSAQTNEGSTGSLGRLNPLSWERPPGNICRRNESDGIALDKRRADNQR
jgi:hypothetical protein